ncbi:hypothetical protein BDW75DRAFT_239197 [Aspergillus navahoensis]
MRKKQSLISYFMKAKTVVMRNIGFLRGPKAQPPWAWGLGWALRKTNAKAYVKNGHEVLRIGYERYTKKGMNFMMRTPGGVQFVALPEHIEEIRAAKDTELHNLPANNDLMQTDYTMHPVLSWDQYHFNVVQRQLTHNLGECESGRRLSSNGTKADAHRAGPTLHCGLVQRRIQRYHRQAKKLGIKAHVPSRLQDHDAHSQ